MAPFDIRQQLDSEIDLLDREEQIRLLEFARELKASTLGNGMPWEQMKRYAGVLPDDAASEILAAIEEDCETIDAEKW